MCINSVYDITDDDGNELDKSGFLKLKQMWKYDKSTCEFDPNNEACELCNKIRDPENVRKGRNFAKDLKKVLDNCPTKSMEFNSPFSGTVTILKNQLYKCDPNGCKACVNICPTESFFIPQLAEDILKYGKIACNEDTCMYCGACENACPQNIIIVNRDKVAVEIPKKAENKPWENRWNRQFSNLTLTKEELNRQIEKDAEEIIISDEYKEIDQEFEQITPSIPFSKANHLREREKNTSVLEKMEQKFNMAHVRYFIHKKRINKLKNYLKKELNSK
ncbi:MAG: 4Fe-4S binding protein [Promethearchaeota archaeon]